MPQNKNKGNKRQTNRQPQRNSPSRAQGQNANRSMSNEEMRREHRAERQRQQRMRRRIFYVTLSLIVVIVGIVLSLTVFFNITTINVEGDSIYTDKEIIAASGVQVGDNLFLVSRDTARTSITEKLPFAGNVEFSNKLPGTLTITVANTSIKCAIETEDGYILMNENGKVLATVDTLEEIYENAVYLDASGKVIESETPVGENAEEGKNTEEKKAEEGTTSSENKKSEDGVDSAKSEESVEDTTASETKKIEGSTAVAEGDEPKDDTAMEGDKTEGENAKGEFAESIEETKSVKYVLSDEKIIILKGVAIKDATPGLPLEVENDRTMKLYQEIMSVLAQNKIEDINEINLEDTFNVTLMYQNRIEILVGSVSNLENKLALCREILDNQNEISPYQKGTIDLTIDKKAYFSPYSEQTTLAQVQPETDGTSEGKGTTSFGEDVSGDSNNTTGVGNAEEKPSSGGTERTTKSDDGDSFQDAGDSSAE